MIYQPRNITPSNISIDATTQNQYFTMEINTNDFVTAYKLEILNWDNSVRYTGEKIILSSPVYNGETLNILLPSDAMLVNGNDYKWHIKLYQNTSDMMITYGFVQQISTATNVYIQKNINIKEGMSFKYNDEIRTISEYNNETGLIILSSSLSSLPVPGGSYTIYSDFIQTVPEYILYVRANAEVDITNAENIFPDTKQLSEREYSFVGTYTQSDNIPLSYHIWNLFIIKNRIYDILRGEEPILELIKTTEKVYNRKLEFSYDGFKTGEYYALELITETEFGNISYSGLRGLYISYETIEYLEKPTATVDENKNAVQIDWKAPTSFSPSLINNNIYSGEVQPGLIGTKSFYIEKGIMGISEEDIFESNNVELNIVSYNYSTGLITMVEDIPDFIENGVSYYIKGKSNIPLDSALTLLKGVPYSGVNSVGTNNYSLEYENNETEYGLGIYPDNYDITLQFKPDSNFFYGVTGVFNDLNPIFLVESNNVDGIKGLIIVFVHIYDIVSITPQLDEQGETNIKYIASPPEGELNTNSHIYLEDDINLEETSYIYFPEYSYVEKISAYNTSTRRATFNKDLPFTPETNDVYVMMNTLVSTTYTNPIDTWCLQDVAYSQINLDYRWIDSNNLWNDNQYWVEGGTAIVRIAEYWWKLEVTNNNIRLEKGGV